MTQKQYKNNLQEEDSQTCKNKIGKLGIKFYELYSSKLVSRLHVLHSSLGNLFQVYQFCNTYEKHPSSLPIHIFVL